MNVQKVITTLGWFFWFVLYIGLIDAALWYIFIQEAGISIWDSASLFGKIGIIAVAVGAFLVYTIIMLYVAVLFDALSARIVHSLLKVRQQLTDYKNNLGKTQQKVSKDVNSP